MTVLLLFFILLFLVFWFIKPLFFRVYSLKNLMTPLLCILFILGLIFFSKTAISAANKGISLWLNIVVPSLFPFFVAAELLSGTGFVRKAGKLLEPVMRPIFNVPGCGSFALAMGISSGYPVGAKITADLRRNRVITREEAERLIAFTNNSGPLFIFGAVSVGMLNMPELGLPLFLCHVFGGITVGFLFRYYGKSTNAKSGSRHHSPIPSTMARQPLSSQGIGTLLSNAVKNSLGTIIAIGGFIIFFSVLIHLLLEIGIIGWIAQLSYIFISFLGIEMETISAVLSGIFEITTGTSMAAGTLQASLTQKMTAVSLIIGWAGLSVHSQVFGIISGTDIRIYPYLLGKLLQSLLSGCYTYLLIKTTGLNFFSSKPAFLQDYESLHPHWYQNLITSTEFLGMTLLLILTFFLLLSLVKTLKKIFP